MNTTIDSFEIDSEPKKFSCNFVQDLRYCGSSAHHLRSTCRHKICLTKARLCDMMFLQRKIRQEVILCKMHKVLSII